jgi:tripartite-type tricarboxylate transporter receptor subunit TctC
MVKAFSKHIAALLVGACFSTPVLADDVADFYKGKVVTIVISSSAGGGYDTLARTIARHLGDHIPGNPTLIVQNMPGAGGIVATNYLYNIAAKDGTVIGGVQNNTPFEPLYGTKEAQYDATKFEWLGSPSVETGMLTVWKTSPAMTIGDAKTQTVTVGATGANSTPSFYARLLNVALGTKLDIISGYKGQNEVFLAMERGEVQGAPSLFYSSLVSTRPSWLPDGSVRVLVQYGTEKEEKLGNVPFANDLVSDPKTLELMKVAFAPLAFGRPYLAPPEVPADRVAALQKGFEDMMKDPAFVSDAQGLGLEVDSPRNGQQLADTLTEAYSAPPEIVTQIRQLIAGNAE